MTAPSNDYQLFVRAQEHYAYCGRQRGGDGDWQKERVLDKPSLSSDTRKLTAVTECQVLPPSTPCPLPLLPPGTAERDIVMFMPQWSNLYSVSRSMPSLPVDKCNIYVNIKILDRSLPPPEPDLVYTERRQTALICAVCVCVDRLWQACACSVFGVSKSHNA